MSYRTALSGLLVLFFAALATTGGATAGPGKGAVPPLIFPVVGQVSYTDDFGDARGSGRHEGNDLMAPKRASAVAVEPGTIKFWTTSARAGCMLYLYGDSGTTYLYIHLNNDLTLGNDNRGTCVPGVAYASGMKSGARVKAGQPIAFVGDSGDANGAGSHLHFEVHPKDGAAVDPFPYLTKAKRLLVAPPASGGAFTLKLQGTVVTAADRELDLKVDSLQAWPSHQKVTKVGKTLTLDVPVGVDLTTLPPVGVPPTGRKVAVWTLPTLPTLDALTGAANALSVERIELR
jgi:hypothetical protein